MTLFGDDPKPAEPEPPPTPVKRPKIASVDLGESRGQFECFRCGGALFDIMQRERGHIWLWCWLCGARQWETAPVGGEFVFDVGRFAGLRLDQVAGQDGGLEYIEFMASKSKVAIVREKCRAWLDSRRTDL